MMNIKKVLLLSFALFLLMGFACASNSADIDECCQDSNLESIGLNCTTSHDFDSLSSQSGLNEDDSVLSETHVVDDGTFSGIEDAISASNPGDTIYLGDKRYVGDGSAIHVDRDHLKFVGESKSNKATLDARGLGRIFNVKQATDITFKNIRFINGKYENEGSGIISFGRIYVEDCEFTNNTGDSGTCIFLSQDADDSSIINCTFTNNKALYGWDGWAEGAAIDSHVSNTRIIDCTFKNNFAVNSGGAIALRNGKNNIIKNCVFTSNTSPIAGAAYLKNTTAQITGSSFNLNQATDNRGGAITISDSNVIIDSSNFTSNNADYGGAIYNFPDSELAVKNSNFIKNNADNGGCIYSNGELSINNSNFTSNECKNGKAIIYSTKQAKITYSSFTSNSKNTDSYLLYLNCDKNTISNNNFENNQKAAYSLNNNEISFNKFKNNKNGLILKNNNKIYSNTFSGNGIAVNSGNNNQIYSNTFENNKLAVDSGDKNQICSNVFTGNDIAVDSGNNNKISFNNFSNNHNSVLSNNKNNFLNNTFKNNEICVVLNESNTVSSNVFYNNSMALKCLKSNKIMNNSFSYNENCAQLAGSSNELVSNSFSHNTIGIKLIQSNSNIIKSNSFSCNYQNSIKGTGSRNQLKGNKFTNNGLSGKYCNVYIRGDENKASKNIFKNNNYHALHFNGNKTIITNNIFKDTGNISLRVNGNNIKIKNNNFTGNKNTQMQVFGNNNRIYNNIIKNGSGRGISIYGNHNKIFKNKVKSNKLIGVYIKGKLNNLTRNNATGSKKGILIHGDKNIIFKSNIKKNNNIGTHILGNSNQLSKNNITKSNKGLFIHGNKNNILQNVIKNNEIGVHNYKSKNNKINYNYIVNKKHNLYGNGSIDADYNWWGKNKPSKVSKSFKINKFVVMYLTAPHTLKINKTYKISIRFKDNEDKKLKYSIPSLSTKHYFNDYIKTNESMVKHNALKTVIRVNKERDCYELKIVCDGETIIKSYYYDNGKITIEKPDSVVHIYKFENKDGKNKNKLKAGSNSSIPYYLSDLFGKFYKNSYFKKFLNFCLKYSQGFKLNSSRSYNENGVLFVSYFAKRLSGDIITGKQSVHGFEFLKTSAFAFYTFGAFCEAFINCNGDPIAFLKYPFLTIPGYSKTSDNWGIPGFLIKIGLDISLGIDENGNLSIGDLALDALSLLCGGGVLVRAGKKLTKISLINKLSSKLKNLKLSPILNKTIFSSKLWKKFKKRYPRIANYLFKFGETSLKFDKRSTLRTISYISSLIDFSIKPLTTSVSLILEKSLKIFKNQKRIEKLSKYLFNSDRDIGNILLADYDKIPSNLNNIKNNAFKNFNHLKTKFFKTIRYHKSKIIKKSKMEVKKSKIIKKVIPKAKRVVHYVKKSVEKIKGTVSKFKKTVKNVNRAVKRASNSVKRFVSKFKFW